MADAPHEEPVAPDVNGTHSGEGKDKTADASPSVPPESHIPPTIKNTRAAERKKKCWLEWGKFAIEALTLIVVLVYTRVAYRQWEEMRRATSDSEKSFRLDERAWVEIEPVKPLLVAPANGKFEAAFRYDIYPKNVGKTVATDVRIRAMAPVYGDIQMGNDPSQVSSFQDKILVVEMHATNPDGSPADVPIGQPTDKVLSPNTVATVPFTLNGQAPHAFSKGEWVAYLIGRIDYIDAFEVPHWHKFCFFTARPTGELWNCKEGNDEDRNPENPPN